MDIEEVGKNLSDAQLVDTVRARHDEESVLAALKQLSRTRSLSRPEVFRTVLDDPEQFVSAKKTVAVMLGNERLPANQKLLVRQLAVKDASLFAAVALSLGRIGDEQALEQLERTDAPTEDYAKRALDFGKSLLAYRLRLGKHLIAPPRPTDLVDVTDGFPFQAVNAEIEAVRKALRDVEKDLPAVPLAEEGMVKLLCRSGQFLLVFTEEFRRPEALKTIKDRSALPLVLLNHSHSLERYFLDTYFFTHPIEGPGEVALLGTRPRGELTYAGNMWVAEQTLTFTLKSVDTLYAPAVDVVGRYALDQRTFEFTKALSSAKVAARNRRAGRPRKATPGLQ